ncbi:patatin-like phospholipase family protein [Aquabacterium sp.]|uniref:patatin-like phospholipase family protein n=1 Tax=Aquabacterium sp. TaxID=1872578 RepID=UPI002CB37448|nr:patatin-like phospholipase family protein [Aquabacterium sp.]HSW08056.1 patatin-like phospholipase family protein [Aquabacterium sp.]
MYETPLTGLVLTGGGARAAYQVGVLAAIARLRRESGTDLRRNPFGVICGTSAGAINAAALACQADRFDAAVEVLSRVWREFRAEQVYRADSLGVIRSGAQWLTMLSIGWVLARWRRARPRSMLNNEPLAELLGRAVQFDRLPSLLGARHLQALAITASSYSSGEHVTFYQSAAEQPPWTRTQRVAVPTQLAVPHLLASSAIPFVFPATELERGGQREWFGDGSMRQTAPISPAIHLGAQRLVIIGAGRMHEPPGRQVKNTGYPTLAQIAGHALSGIFLDALMLDVERMERINRTLALLPESARRQTPLQPIQALVIAPSQRLDDIAARHQAHLPAPVRALLRGVGVSGSGQDARGAALASYLLFEASYTQELMTLGAADVQARRDEVRGFFGWQGTRAPHETVPQAQAAGLS